MKRIKQKRRAGNRYIPSEKSRSKFQPPLEKFSNNWLFTLRDGVIYLRHHR